MQQFFRRVQRWSQSGFTLLELLVVISIIGILTALAAVSYSTAQSRARDSRRHGDLDGVQKGLEQYYQSNNSSYPTQANCYPAAMASYLPNGIPKDPRTGVTYSISCTATTYCMCAAMESATDTNANANCAGTAGVFYCVHNLQ
jgi:prepilin-type N-terminal cleavage/methylation domain-containing protein